MTERELKVIENEAEVQYEVPYKVWSEEEVRQALDKLPLPEEGDATTLAKKLLLIGRSEVTIGLTVLWDLRNGDRNYVPFEGMAKITGSVKTGHAPTYSNYPILFSIVDDGFLAQTLKYDLDIKGRTMQGFLKPPPDEAWGIIDGEETRDLILPSNEDILSDIAITFHKDNG